MDSLFQKKRGDEDEEDFNPTFKALLSKKEEINFAENPDYDDCLRRIRLDEAGEAARRRRSQLFIAHW